MSEGRGRCPCTANKKQLPVLPPNACRFLKTLHLEKHILTEEECGRVWKAGDWWDELSFATAVKPSDVVQRTLDVLEEYKDEWWYRVTATRVKVLSALNLEKLMTKDEIRRMKEEEGYLNDRLMPIQCLKLTEVVSKTADVLYKFGYKEEPRMLRVLNELFTRHLLRAEECSEVARNRSEGTVMRERKHGLLVHVLISKPAETVQEASQVLEEHGYHVKELKMLSELYLDKLMTKDEMQKMNGEEGYLPFQLISTQCTKPPEVVTRTTDVLDKFGYKEEAMELRVLNELFTRQLLTAEECSEVIRKGRTDWEYHLHRVLSAKPFELVQEVNQVLEKHGCSVIGIHRGSSDLTSDSSRYAGYRRSPRYTFDSGLGSCSLPTDLEYSRSSIAHSILPTASLAPQHQLMRLHSIDEESSLSPEKGEEAAKHHATNSAGGGSSPPKDVDIAAVKAAEAALDDLCWIPFAVQSQSVGPEGGKLCLQSSAGAMGGEEGQTILLEVPPGAVSPSESVVVHFAVIPVGPFMLPEGYQFGSMVVYIHYDGRRITQPLRLYLPHWYGGEDHVRDGLSFAMAPHTLKEGENVYRFELVDGGMFSEQRRCGVLQLTGHCSLFGSVFRKAQATSLYYASLWTHQVGGKVIADNEMRNKVVITYASQYWIKILTKYWKDCKRNRADPTVRFTFSEEKIQGKLSFHHGEGWQACLTGTGMVHKSEVAYHVDRKSRKGLMSAVEQHIYPPAIHCAVVYSSPPDCSRGARLIEMNIEGTDKTHLPFLFKVHEVNTPHTPSSLSALISSAMGDYSTPVLQAATACEDSSQSEASTVDSGKDSFLLQSVYDRPDHLTLLRTYVSRTAAGKGRAVLEGVGLDSATIAACFTSHPLNDEETVQAGLTKWKEGKGQQPPTWAVLLGAMNYAQIAHQHVTDLKDRLGT